MWPQELGTKTERTARNQAGKQIDAKSARAKQKLQHPEKRQCNVKPDSVSKTAVPKATSSLTGVYVGVGQAVGGLLFRQESV